MNRLINVRTMSFFVLFLQLFISCAHEEADIVAAIEGDQVEVFIPATIYYEIGDTKTAIVYTEEGYKKTFKNGAKIDQVKGTAPDPLVLPDGIDPDYHELHENNAWTDAVAIELTTVDAEGNEHPIAGAYYVTTSGNSSNDGKSETKSWPLDYALKTAKAGDVVYIKSGNYGAVQVKATQSGTINDPIRFIGYKSTPGDVASSEGSTFQYNETVSASKMPLISMGSDDGIPMEIVGDYVTVENIQIYRGKIGFLVNGTNATLKNVICIDQGSQTNSSAYSGFGIRVVGDNATLLNCFVEDANAEAVNIKGSDNTLISYCKVHAKNSVNPIDYFFLLGTGTYNTIIEHSEAKRELGLSHGGHGFMIKDLAENNIIRNCVAFDTSFEIGFSGVKNNLFTDCKIIGSGTDGEFWPAVIKIKNGANNNTFKNFYIENVWTAIAFSDDDDGFVGPGGDRDLENCGFDNTFVNIVINTAYRLVTFGSGAKTSPVHGNKFYNCTFYNYQNAATFYNENYGNGFYNSTFEKGTSIYNFNAANSMSINMTVDHCNFYDMKGSVPSGTSVTQVSSGFKNASGGDFSLNSSSNLIDKGTSNEFKTDFNNKSRPKGGAFDIGAYEY
ncbi:choice-of-anchor Q domain-containing protein [Robertkochia solimangrovi]|uniref:choice-of-anchor Q domain-containing protein n=1 Tax=Robertkochia solimangrovi TaxID=2213046 RepID=UPI00117DF5DE|nr:choice-of-anchor Q domain-containing protein [Robertkochia solimangrovi]TRZ45023.1 hypothetical protein DMZ48_04475 [Robertkochia solimangrovi]